MKEILLVGRIKSEDSVLNDIIRRNDYKIVRVKSANNAIKILKQSSPDFVLCTGRIRKTSEGYYFLEL